MKWLDSPEHTLIELLGARLDRPQPVGVDNWPAVLALARTSRTVALLHQVVRDRIDLSDDLRRELLSLGQRSFVETTAAIQALNDVAHALTQVHWLVLRGPALGARLYGDLAVRPFGDLDLLVAEHDVEPALKALRQIGFAFPAGALAEEYYRRYHLHFELVRPGPPVTSRLELHWALDHPFTLLTLDPTEILKRSQLLTIDRFSVPVPQVNDLVLTLAIHLVKHLVQLPTQLDSQSYAEIVSSGFLLQLFDIALALHTNQMELDWDVLPQRAAQWGATDSLRLSLETVEALWPGLTTSAQRARFQPSPRRWVERLTQRILANSTAVAFGLRKDIFFRPARLLDSLAYVLPPAEYLQRRYGSAKGWVSARHSMIALFKFAKGAWQLGYYLLLKRWRPARSGSGK